MRAPSQNCGNFYPRESVRLDQQGDAELQFTLKADGTVKDISVAKSSGHDSLDEAATECVSHWHYNPATHSGVPVEMPWRTVVKFRVDNGPPLAVRRYEWGEYRCIDESMPSEDEMKKTTYGTGLDFTLRDGAIADAKIFRTSGNEKLDEQALQCFRNLKIDSDDDKTPSGSQEYHLFVTWNSTVIAAMVKAAARYTR